MRWSYEIVPVGGYRRLVGGSFEAPHLEAAKRYVQTVSDPAVTAEAELDVRILDGSGGEVWRGTYVGPNATAP
jgi:hypothetical protein